MMARPIRIPSPRAVYLVMARGSHGQAVSGDNADGQQCLGTLREDGEKTGWRIHACVLMHNHYHPLRHHTTVSVRRASERFAVGHSMRVCQAIRRVRHRPAREGKHKSGAAWAGWRGIEQQHECSMQRL